MNFKLSFPSVIYLTLGKEVLCRVLKKHSAKKLFAECHKKILGKELVCRVFSFSESFLFGTR
jgi:hypothetical protein